MDPSEAFKATRARWSTTRVSSNVSPKTEPQVNENEPSTAEQEGGQPVPVNAMLVIAESIASSLSRIAAALEALQTAATTAFAAAATVPIAVAGPLVKSQNIGTTNTSSSVSTAPTSAAGVVSQAAVPEDVNETAPEPDIFDYGMGANNSEDDTDPSSRCGVCKAGTDEAYALQCGHYPYCEDCVKKLRGSFHNASFACPFCKALGKDPLKLVL